MNNLKSYTEYAVTTSTTDFVIGFVFNYGTDAVNVTVNGVPATTAGYTVVHLNSTTIRLTPAVTSGVVRLQRETDIDQSDHAYRAGAKFLAQTMDENFTQIRHAQQEVRDAFEYLEYNTLGVVEAAKDATERANNVADEVEGLLDRELAHNDLHGRDVAGAHSASAIRDASGKTQQVINDNQQVQNNSFKSMLRKTPYDFGAKGGSNDDTQAVIACINSGYFLINDVHNCRPFKIENKNLNGEFSDKGRLIAIPTANIDTFEFVNCTGEIRSWYMTENYTAGVYASFLLRQCKNMNVYRLFVTGGKLVPVAMVDCDECYIHNSAGIGFVSQRPFEWVLAGSRNSQYINCHLYNHQFGFVIIGSAYKSGTRLMTTRPILETLGMKAVGCTVNNATRTCFDINGAVGAEFLDCVADQQGQSVASPGFQIKQSTVVPEEGGLDSYMNKITNPTAINCAVALQAQDGHIAKITNLTAINIKTTVLQLNKTPRFEVDGIYVYNFGLDMVNHNSAGGKANVLYIQNGSGNCVIRNVNVVIDGNLTSKDLVEFISNTSNNVTIDGFKVTLLNSTDVFSKFLHNTGNFLKLLGDIRVGDATKFTTLIDDSSTSTIYPTVISKVFDLVGATENMYFDQMQSNGLIVGKVSTTALDLAGSDAQVAVGISGNVAGLRGLAVVASGTEVTNPGAIKSLVANTPIVLRRQAGTTGTGKVLVQVRGFDRL